MYRIDFACELTALEIRQPFTAACKDVAGQYALFANFQQPQQRAFMTTNGRKIRIGNGGHKAWRINYQSDPTWESHPRVVGAVAIKAPLEPSANQYGGFDYGPYGGPTPHYRYITLHTIGEAGLHLYHANDDLYEPTVEAVKAALQDIQPRLY